MVDFVYERIKKFHAHLDVCSQCRDHPFGLCRTGASLLKYAATGELDNHIRKEVTNDFQESRRGYPIPERLTRRDAGENL